MNIGQFNCDSYVTHTVKTILEKSLLMESDRFFKDLCIFKIVKFTIKMGKTPPQLFYILFLKENFPYYKMQSELYHLFNQSEIT